MDQSLTHAPNSNTSRTTNQTSFSSSKSFVLSLRHWPSGRPPNPKNQVLPHTQNLQSCLLSSCFYSHSSSSRFSLFLFSIPQCHESGWPSCTHGSIFIIISHRSSKASSGKAIRTPASSSEDMASNFPVCTHAGIKSLLLMKVETLVLLCCVFGVVLFSLCTTSEIVRIQLNRFRVTYGALKNWLLRGFNCQCWLYVL